MVVDGGGIGNVTAGSVRGAGDGMALLLRLRGELARCTVVVHPVNGHPGLVIRDGELVVAVISVDIERGRASGVWAVTNPDKLARWNR